MITITWSASVTSTLPTGGDTLNLLPGALELDILEGEAFEISSLVTEHAIEEGAAITDHQIPNLDRVSFDFMVSDSPISVAQGVLGTTIAPNAAGGIVVTSPSILKSENTLDTLRDLCRQGVEVDIVGLQRLVEGWLITSVTTNRRPETAGGLVATVVVQEMATAALVEVEAPAPRVERARPSRDTGQQVTTPAGNSTVSPEPQYRDTGLQSCRDDYYFADMWEPL